MTKIFVFDVDGTLANCEHRRGFVASKPKNWPAFERGMVKDTPYDDIIWLMNTFGEDDKNIIIVATGRNESSREKTTDWLRKHTNICIAEIYMRADGDDRSDNIVKEEILAEIRNDFGEPFMVFDDRQQVVDMWRRNGVRCLQVQPGDF